MKKIYIAGKIGTWNINEVSNECKEKFANTEKWLREKYKGKCSIINPLKLIADRAEFLGEDNLDKIGIFTECVSGVMHSDAIYLLKDWQESEGATIEKQIAEYLGKEIIFEKEEMSTNVDIASIIEDIKQDYFGVVIKSWKTTPLVNMETLQDTGFSIKMYLNSEYAYDIAVLYDWGERLGADSCTVGIKKNKLVLNFKVHTKK